jgi:hypothetical protein
MSASILSPPKNAFNTNSSRGLKEKRKIKRLPMPQYQTIDTIEWKIKNESPIGVAST